MARFEARIIGGCSLLGRQAARRSVCVRVVRLTGANCAVALRLASLPRSTLDTPPLGYIRLGLRRSCGGRLAAELQSAGPTPRGTCFSTAIGPHLRGIRHYARTMNDVMDVFARSASPARRRPAALRTYAPPDTAPASPPGLSRCRDISRSTGSATATAAPAVRGRRGTAPAAAPIFEHVFLDQASHIET